MFRKILYFFVISVMFSVHALAQVKAPASHDSSKPVEITADSLEVLQDQNKAIFTGDVVAKQGEMDIHSDKMTVYYKGGNTTGKASDDKKQTSDASKISKVEIDGNVFISNLKETAKGNKGVYDVDSSIIILEGDVTLTSQKNIVKGQKLVYNLKTGQSKMVSGSGVNSSGKKERVRSVFVPNGK